MQFALFVLTAWMWVGGTFDAILAPEPSPVVLADGSSPIPPPPPPPGP